MTRHRHQGWPEAITATLGTGGNRPCLGALPIGEIISVS
jgi:hypothetical protein